MYTFIAILGTVSGNAEIKESLTGELLRFRKRSASVVSETMEDLSHVNFLEKLSHIDYRNCQCDGIISCLFWRLHQHIENSGKIRTH